MKTKILILCAAVGLIAGCSSSSNSGGIGNEVNAETGVLETTNNIVNPPGNGEPYRFERQPTVESIP